MNMILIRKAFRDTYTVGDLYLDGQWTCNTLEPHAIDWTWQKKAPGRTAIPCGRYEVRMGHSARFNCQMPFLQDVPHFKGVMIHRGMTARDTAGCILVGENTIKATLLRTRQTFAALMVALGDALARGEKLWISVEERPRV